MSFSSILKFLIKICNGTLSLVNIKILEMYNLVKYPDCSINQPKLYDYDDDDDDNDAIELMRILIKYFLLVILKMMLMIPVSMKLMQGDPKRL